MACKKPDDVSGRWPYKRRNNYYRKERQVNPALKNYYSIEKYMVLPDDADSSFLICVDAQTLELLHSLIEPKYAARWYREDTRATDNRRRITSEKDMAWVDKLWARLQDQLADMACISELSEAIKTQNTLIKYQIALMSNDGRVMHDEKYLDPQNALDPSTNPDPDDIQIKDDVGISSVWRTENWIYPNNSVTDALAGVLERGLITQEGIIPILPWEGTGLADIHEQIRLILQQMGLTHEQIRLLEKAQEVALKHINGKLSRDNAVPTALTEDGPLLSGNQSKSAFTYDRVLPGAENEWLGSILIEALRAGVLPSATIPGLGDIGGRYGIGIADLLKMPEPARSYLGGSLIYDEGVYYFDSTLTGKIQIYPPFVEGVQGESITRKLTEFFQLTAADPFTRKHLDGDVLNFVQIMSQGLLKKDGGHSWFDYIWQAVDYLKCLCEGVVGIESSIDGVKDAIEAGNSTPAPGVDLTKVEANLMAIANAIDSLEIAGRNDTTTIEAAIDRLAAATEDISITTIANSGEMAQISVGGCCPDLPDPTIPVDPTTTDPTTDDVDPLPWLPDPILADGECEPYIVAYLIEALDYMLGAWETLTDLFGDVVGDWLARKLIITLAVRSGQVASIFSALGIVIVTAGPDPLVDPPTITATVGGVMLGEAVLYLVNEFGIDGLRILIDWMKNNQSTWDDIECGDYDSVIVIADTLKTNAKDWIDVNVGNYDIPNPTTLKDAISYAVEVIIRKTDIGKKMLRPPKKLY